MRANTVNETAFEIGQRIIERHDAHMTINYRRYPIAIERGEGAHLYDHAGRRYLDLFAGFGAGLLGHCHPDLVRAVCDQAARVWHAGNLLHTEPQTLVAEAIARHGFGGRSFFCHAGADANEAALKLARLYGKERPGDADPAQGGRFGVIAMHNSFHGRTFGTMPATGQAAVSAGYEPLLDGYAHVPFGDLDALRAAIDARTIAVIVEPIQGEGGINVPGADYLPGLRRLCDEHDLLLICDEVWTGCGRTGRWFAHQHWDVTPDIMTLAKGVGGGLAVGVMCTTPRLADLLDGPRRGSVAHASTLGGNCLAMAASSAVFDVLERDRLVERAAALGEATLQRLGTWIKDGGPVRAVRGRGLFLGIEMDRPAADVVARCLDRGVLVNATAGNVLRLAPPLVVTETDLDEGLSVLEQAIS